MTTTDWLNIATNAIAYTIKAAASDIDKCNYYEKLSHDLDVYYPQSLKLWADPKIYDLRILLCMVHYLTDDDKSSFPTIKYPHEHTTSYFLMEELRAFYNTHKDEKLQVQKPILNYLSDVVSFNRYSTEMNDIFGHRISDELFMELDVMFNGLSCRKQFLGDASFEQWKSRSFTMGQAIVSATRIGVPYLSNASYDLRYGIHPLVHLHYDHNNAKMKEPYKYIQFVNIRPRQSFFPDDPRSPYLKQWARAVKNINSSFAEGIDIADEPKDVKWATQEDRRIFSSYNNRDIEDLISIFNENLTYFSPECKTHMDIIKYIINSDQFLQRGLTRKYNTLCKVYILIYKLALNECKRLSGENKV